MAEFDGGGPTVRPAEARDAADVIDVRLAAWRTAYADLMPAHVLAGLDDDRDESVERLAERLRSAAGDSTMLVGLEPSGRVAGMCAYGPARENGVPGEAELYALNVHPRAWGTGVGTALLSAAERALAAAPAAYLWVIEGNARARRFYARSGWRPDGGHKVDARFGTQLTEVRYRPADSAEVSLDAR